MARYRKVDPRIWNDAKFSSFPERGKLLFFYVLTHPNMTMVGMLRATPEGLFSELGLSEADCEAGWQAVCRAGVVQVAKQGLIRLPNFLKYNAPESPSVVKSWPSCFDLLPECDLLNEAKRDIENYLIQKGKSWIDAYRGTTKQPNGQKGRQPAKQSAMQSGRHQEQEQEQDKEEVKEKPQCRKADAIRPSPLVEKIVAVYEETTKGRLSQIQAMTDKRKRAVKKFVDFYRKQVNAVDEAAFLSAVREYFRRAVRSSFLTGQNDRGWKADFDFLMNENKALALLEGKYDDKKTETNQFRTPVHDWRAEQDAYFAKKREEELDHAEALEACLCGAKA